MVPFSGLLQFWVYFSFKAGYRAGVRFNSWLTTILTGIPCFLRGLRLYTLEIWNLIQKDMGILDQLKGPIIQEVMGLIKNQEGGLSGLVNKLKSSGLGDQVNSWIGTGENSPVSANQMNSALGGDFIKNMAERLGVTHEEAAGNLADALPQVVDKLTPNGKIENDDLLQKGLSALKGLFG